MSDQDHSYTIVQTAQLLGISPQKLRRWDEQGILGAQRTEGGHRRYPKEVIDRLVLANGGAFAEKTSRELASIKKTLAEKRRIIQLLIESEGRYRDLVETSHDLIWQTDTEGRFTYLNAAAHEIFGLAPRDLLGRCFFSFEANGAHVPNRRFLSTLRRNGEVQNHVTHLSTARGEDRWIGINARVTRDENGEMLGIRGTARDVTEQHLAIRRAEYVALHDALTDLPNRGALQRQIESALQTGRPGAIVMIDMDHFKRVNTAFGHGAGDQLVIGLSGVLRSVARDRKGELFRVGEDQFVLHLPEARREDAQAAAAIALDAVQNYRLETAHNRVVSSITASIGIALHPLHGDDWATLFAATDAATHQAKDQGRNRVALFNPASDALRASHRRTQWSRLITEALEQDEIALYVQPAVQLRTGAAVHHEIFVRIRDERGAWAEARQFMGSAESMGYAPALDQRVLTRVLTHLHENSQLPRQRYSVNLSAASISDSAWVREMVDIVKTSDVSGERLVFEVSEKAAMENIDATAAFIDQLRPLGSRFALDDFGTGFSSFYYLKRFEVDYLKIHRSFTQDLQENAESRVFIRALNGLARELNRQVVAKGVESAETLKLLKEAGTLYAQGKFLQPVARLGAGAVTARNRKSERA
ncbi:MAG: EAL domain-containing protein [Burkholderiales bacterium]|jgi:diguanylate cyclase (GGDEF)-like protein/PAS domain S-box-containing protein|nr:EAL domain-containing protein [Burkholderiales bacterium]